MKLKLLLITVVFGCFLETSAQDQPKIIFEDDFETYNDFAIENIGEWTLRDLDSLNTYGFQGVVFPNMGAPFAFIVFNSDETVPAMSGSIWSAYSGEKCMAAFAVEPTDGIINNDWLISPKIKLLESNNKVSFYAKSSTLEYGADRFKVGISTTDTEVGSFTIISPGSYVETTDDWTEYTYDLDQYSDRDVYIAINCVSEDAFGFLVDDFKVVGGRNASINKELESKFTVFPTVTSDVVHFTNSGNILVLAVEVRDLNGRKVQSFNFSTVASSQFNISQLQAGVYFLNITTEEGSFTKKIIKK